MGRCATCGNDYDKSFTVTVKGISLTFDCFECAIHALAPVCPQCGCRVIGHGIEEDGWIYCCAHCAVKTIEVGTTRLPSTLGSRRARAADLGNRADPSAPS